MLCCAGQCCTMLPEGRACRAWQCCCALSQPCVCVHVWYSHSYQAMFARSAGPALCQTPCQYLGLQRASPAHRRAYFCVSHYWHVAASHTRKCDVCRPACPRQFERPTVCACMPHAVCTACCTLPFTRLLVVLSQATCVPVCVQMSSCAYESCS